MPTLTPHLWFNGDCKQAIAFYQQAFGAELMAPPVPSPDGKGVLHVMLKIGTSPVMMADAWPGAWEHGPKGSATMGLWLYVADCDALFARAHKAGCEVMMPVMDAFWGDRMGKLKDPFGHCWAIATHKYDLTPEEIGSGQQQWQASLGDDETAS